MIESSIVIPVYNKWELTRNCLASLAAHSPVDRVEVIVVDNASTDATSRDCEPLGRELFGGNFRYERNAVNRNFAGASNQGAELARGEYVIFLNNDTEVTRGWRQPLIADFAAYPDIGATGPLLVYPDATPLGRLVQHLGVCVFPSYKFGHLYKGIPAASPLARKRRFFRAITAACFAIKKNVFLATGKFDERFINGWEDVDLCARLWARGLRMTVNPASQVIHYESQTPGRSAHEEANSKLLLEKGLFRFAPDWHFQIKQDGFWFKLSEWLNCENAMPEGALRKLQPALDEGSLQDILRLLIANPYWRAGWEKALALTADLQKRVELFKIYFQLFPTPELAIRAFELGKEAGGQILVENSLALIRIYYCSPDDYLHVAQKVSKLCKNVGLPEIAAAYGAWIADYDNFKNRIFPPFAERYIAIERELGRTPKKVYSV